MNLYVHTDSLQPYMGAGEHEEAKHARGVRLGGRPRARGTLHALQVESWQTSQELLWKWLISTWLVTTIEFWYLVDKQYRNFFIKVDVIW